MNTLRLPSFVLWILYTPKKSEPDWRNWLHCHRTSFIFFTPIHIGSNFTVPLHRTSNPLIQSRPQSSGPKFIVEKGLGDNTKDGQRKEWKSPSQIETKRDDIKSKLEDFDDPPPSSTVGNTGGIPVKSGTNDYPVTDNRPKDVLSKIEKLEK